MTVVEIGVPGLRRAREALRAGEAIIAPAQSPLPYALCATAKAAVNRAKSRPAEQPCGTFVHSIDRIAAALDLDAEAFAFARHLTDVEQLNLFVPIVPVAPAWMHAEAADGRLGITTQWLAQIEPLLAHFGYLSATSANRTGTPVALTAAAADRMFDGELLVLDGDRWRSAATDQGSAAIVAFDRDGELRLVRDGVNNRGCPDAGAYLGELRRRYASRL